MKEFTVTVNGTANFELDLKRIYDTVVVSADDNGETGTIVTMNSPNGFSNYKAVFGGTITLGTTGQISAIDGDFRHLRFDATSVSAAVEVRVLASNSKKQP